MGLVISAALFLCALNVNPVTLDAIARVESKGQALAMNVNGLRGPQPHASSIAEAARVAESYIARGYSVDLGLMQVNSRNVRALGYTIEQVLDPCTNIAAGGRILTASYAEASRRMGDGQPALLAALSAYNTGNYSAGFRNGYVAKYTIINSVPAVAASTRQVAAVMRRAAPQNAYTADIEVNFREASNGGFVQ